MTELDTHGDYIVKRHGGRSSDEFKVKFSGNYDDAWKRFCEIRSAMRQGTVVLIGPDGKELERDFSPRLRTRW